MLDGKNVTLYIDIQYFHYIPPYLVPHLRIYPSYQLALLTCDNKNVLYTFQLVFWINVTSIMLEHNLFYATACFHDTQVLLMIDFLCRLNTPALTNQITAN